jgi:hypothetical protein
MEELLSLAIFVRFDYNRFSHSSFFLDIIDGCNFGLRNFTGFNFQLTTINGGFPGSSDSMTLTNTPLTPSANPTTLTFELKNDAGAQANFNGFSEVRFYEQSLKTVIATVSLPGGGAAPGGSSSSTTTTNSASTAIIVDLFGSISAMVASFLVL